MEFFKSQESLTAIQWVLRALVSFIFLLIAAKWMGQRSISQLRFLDFITALILGNIIAHPLSDEELGLEGSMITTAVIIVLYMFSTWLGLKWPLFKRFLDPPPLTLIKDGQIVYDNLAKAKITVEYLFSEARKEKIEDIQKIALAVWEPGGTISVFANPQHLPPTASSMKIATGPFNLVKPIIVKGKIDMQLLREIDKDRHWVEQMVKAYRTDIGDIQLATVDNQYNVRVYLK